MSRKSNVVLKSQARKMVFDVYCYLKKDDKSGIQTAKDTAEATNTSVSTVRRIVKEAKNSDPATAFRTPGKRRTSKKKVTDIDSFDQSVIKRCIHNFHLTNNDLPTVEKLREKLKEAIHYNGSETSLRRILHGLGFRWKKTENKRKLLIEKSTIRLLRIEYLQTIEKFREEGRPIVYTDESYIDASHVSARSWADGSSKDSKKPISKVIIVHAGSEAGFVPNALLLFESKAGTKSGENPDMNFAKYEQWLRSQLLPNLPPNSVVVVDSASYHNKQSDPAPTANSKKAEMQAWLQEKGIEYSDTMLKPQLYDLIKVNKDRYATFIIDQLLSEHNHTVLRLPPYLPDLNPIEMAWATIRLYIRSKSKNDSWNTNKVMELIQEKVALMGANEWSKYCRKVADIEAQYIQSDHIVDSITEKFDILADDSDSDDDDSDDDDEDDDDVICCKQEPLY